MVFRAKWWTIYNGLLYRVKEWVGGRKMCKTSRYCRIKLRRRRKPLWRQEGK
jgi:hypothetical protein